MEIMFDSRFVQYLKLSTRALEEKDPAALHRPAQIYSHRKGKKRKGVPIKRSGMRRL